MASIFKNPSHKAQIGYNGFDMSQLLKFTSTVGELLPVYYDILQPGDKITASTELKTRTMELASSAMCSITEHLEWFFVPMQQIYSIFGQWYSFVGDSKSSLMPIDRATDGEVTEIPTPSIDEWKTFLSALLGNRNKYFGYSGLDARLIDMLGYPIAGLQVKEQYDGSYPLVPCPILACAYQKIYNDFYRLSDREAVNVKSFNLDYWWVVTTPFSTTDLTDIYTLHFRPWRKDFFTSLQISPIMGGADVSAFTADYTITNLYKSFQNWLIPSTEYKPTSNGPSENQSTPTTIAPKISSSTTATVTTMVSAAMTPASLRTAFALEKMLEVTRRAGKSYDAQMLAHFGVKPPAQLADKVIYLGSAENDLKIGDVIATASTESSPLGKIAGKGYGYGRGKDIKFEAPCHGILMCIYSAEPLADYANYMLDKLNLLTNRADWYTPEYDNLGMQPLFSYQRDYDPTTAASGNVIGWQYRYSELKTKYNRVCGAFTKGLSLAYWTPQRYAGAQPIQVSLTLGDYLIPPYYLNDIMLVNFDFRVNPQEMYTYDPLIHELYFDVKKASKMSTYGLPSL